MSIVQSIFLRMFGHPQGLLGRLGGLIMARTNEECGVWVADLLEIGSNDRVLEVGFGRSHVCQAVRRLPVPDGEEAWRRECCRPREPRSVSGSA